MYKFDKLMVCLDLSNMDQLLIKYASYMAGLVEAKHVTFLHIMEDSSFPEDLAEQFPDLAEPLDDIVEEELQEKIDQHFINTDADTNLVVQTGNTTQKIIEFADKNEIDMTLLGKKSGFKGTGVVLGKLARFIHSSILFLPESARHTLNRILVPVDFSNESQLALQEAIKFAAKTDAEIDIQHVYELPKQYFPYNVPTDELKKKMKEHLNEKYQKFMSKLDKMGKEIRYFFTLSEDKTMSENIYNKAINEQADLIIMGSKTKTAATALFKGSSAEKLAKANYNIPLMIIKDKDKTEGLFEAIFK